jgi:hypothetical protein
LAACAYEKPLGLGVAEIAMVGFSRSCEDCENQMVDTASHASQNRAAQLGVSSGLSNRFDANQGVHGDGCRKIG